ncbi:MAG: cyclic nucleotide-binding domain-containing protein [Candidatus Kuenenia stuttgartiensis]|uniref:Cyclic nucleotide-binding domain-containing protein n=2 Tax=Kuenenia stuttgartiensis TaxID=174633 RepID=A0A2C9CH30_KUEST|nr:cyclic nucleotide-binding domain-containing protein [Candidatus Kuenenia stuttgartiensis]SOH05054.1 hypothetical protein KSMBR1_2567 [Candidatus Kuenenia stuttgartiensis]
MEKMYSRIEKVKDGEFIMEEDTWAYFAFVLREGKARMMKKVDGRQVVIGTLNKGDIFGETGFLGEPRRTTSVVAEGDVMVEMIGRDSFMRFFHELPKDVQANLYAMDKNLTIIAEIYSRLVVLFQILQDHETKMTAAKTLEMELEKLPEFVKDMVSAIAKRHNRAVECLNKLTCQIEEKQTKLMSHYS